MLEKKINITKKLCESEANRCLHTSHQQHVITTVFNFIIIIIIIIILNCYHQQTAVYYIQISVSNSFFPLAMTK